MPKCKQCMNYGESFGILCMRTKNSITKDSEACKLFKPYPKPTYGQTLRAGGNDILAKFAVAVREKSPCAFCDNNGVGGECKIKYRKEDDCISGISKFLRKEYKGEL